MIDHGFGNGLFHLFVEVVLKVAFFPIICFLRYCIDNKNKHIVG